MTIEALLYIVAIILFALAAFGVAARINLTACGLAVLTLAVAMSLGAL